MRPSTKLALLGLTLATTTMASQALAQTASPPAPPPLAPPLLPPPLTTDPDISNINGQIVPVGDHNQYHYSFRRWNLSTNPLGWILGSYGLSLSYGFHSNVAFRGDVNYFGSVEGSAVGYEIGVGLPIYFRRTYSGAFLEPGFVLRGFENRDDYGDASSTTFGPQVLFGWHWIWDSGLNIAAACGMGRNWATNDTSSHYDDEKIFVNGYLRFGYAF